VSVPAVSIVVPVLNEAARLPGLLHHLDRQFPDCEVVAVDGGSTDASRQQVGPPARLVRSAPGRGTQLNAGAATANGKVLWFVHADTRPEPAALAQLQAALRDPGVVGGGFSLAFDRRSPILDYVAWSSNIRARCLGWIFGDQAIFVRRDVFDRLDGFPDWPLMEDMELSRRLGRAGRLVLLPAHSVASARRFDEHGAARLVLQMQWLKLAYLAGVDPARLARRYAAGPRRILPARLKPTKKEGAER
jgi:rSAM/selenodomain-associated transferase 2